MNYQKSTTRHQSLIRKILSSMKYKNFEDYLEEICFSENPTVLDDDMPDFFDNWFSELDAQEITEYTEAYVKYIKSELKGELTRFNKWLNNEI